MCGRFSLTSDPSQLAFELDAVDEATAPPAGRSPSEGPRSPRYNIAPTTTIAALVLDTPVPTSESLVEAGRAGEGADGEGSAGDGADGEPRRVLRAMRWGLVPSWARDDGKLPLLFNARVETAAEKPAFRAAVSRRHCVVPMDGWFEWVPGAERPGGKPGPKQPYFMSEPGDRGLLMAGLWERRRVRADDGTETEETTCAILTTEAVGPLRRVHDRMPLVVPADRLDDWLDPEVLTDPRALVDAGLEDWADAVEIRPVSRAVSSVRNDGPELLRPVEVDRDAATPVGPDAQESLF